SRNRLSRSQINQSPGEKGSPIRADETRRLPGSALRRADGSRQGVQGSAVACRPLHAAIPQVLCLSRSNGDSDPTSDVLRLPNRVLLGLSNKVPSPSLFHHRG